MVGWEERNMLDGFESGFADVNGITLQNVAGGPR
jgi:hypothetical protein